MTGLTRNTHTHASFTVTLEYLQYTGVQKHSKVWTCLSVCISALIESRKKEKQPSDFGKKIDGVDRVYF